MFDKLAEAVNADHNLVLRGKTCSLTLLIEIDNDEYFIDIVSGRDHKRRLRPILNATLGFSYPRLTSHLVKILAKIS